jgi:hypothetical protein
MIHTHGELIIKEVLSSLSLDITSLRWFPIVPLLPKTDCELFGLLNIVPNKGFIANEDEKSPSFSALYGKLLEAQKQSFINDIAKKNYADKSYWLNCNDTEIPLFKPNCIGIADVLSNGASYDFTFDSSNYPIQDKGLFPSYPNFLIYQPFLDFNEKAREQRFVFKLHFDKIAVVSTQFGDWFTQGAFIKAYKDKSVWVKGPNMVTWDELFGANGILNLITNGILVASGMTLEIQSFGIYDLKTLLFLKSNLLTSVWPFYLDPQNATNDFSINNDGNITIKVTTSESEILLLAMQAVEVSDLTP